jgi:propionyl-CoA carboxylase alpha chain
VVSTPQRVAFRTPDGPVEVHYRLDRTGALVDRPDVTLLSRAPDEVVLDVAGVRRRFRVHPVAGVSYVDSAAGSVALEEVPRFAPPTSERSAGSLVAPMPGAVGRIAVSVGQTVAAGDVLLTLEAMKMEHAVHAPEAGVVTELPVEPGQQVEPGTVLAVIEGSRRKGSRSEERGSRTDRLKGLGDA